VTTIFTGLVVPAATPLVGMLMLGNLFRECGVVSRLVKTTENELLNLVTIFLGTSIGASMTADLFLNPQTLFILFLGLLALSIGIASGILFAKVMNLLCRDKVNPLIGSAGVSAVPMAARVCQKVGQEADPNNFLLMHAMGPNLAGQIGSPLVAGILLALLGS
jgi:oxaloacetate decarboxylase beta subunit